MIDSLLFLFVKKKMRKKKTMVIATFANRFAGSEISKIKANRLAKTSKNRIISIIILNGINFLVLRFPAAFFSFYGLVYFYDKSTKEFKPSLIGYLLCRSFKVCQCLTELSHLFYLISFLIQFFILFKLDKNFKDSFLIFIISVKKMFQRININ